MYLIKKNLFFLISVLFHDMLMLKMLIVYILKTIKMHIKYFHYIYFGLYEINPLIHLNY